MKKLFAIVLAVAMIAAMAIAVSAEAIQAAGETTIAVEGEYTAVVRDDVYYVTLSTTSLSFTYTDTKYEWDVETMKWDTTAAAGWANNGTATITVTSKSSKAIAATFEAETAGTATLSFKVGEAAAAETATLNLASAANAENPAENGAEKTGSVSVIAGGYLTGKATIGTITVTIA